MKEMIESSFIISKAIKVKITVIRKFKVKFINRFSCIFLIRNLIEIHQLKPKQITEMIENIHEKIEEYISEADKSYFTSNL